MHIGSMNMPDESLIEETCVSSISFFVFPVPVGGPPGFQDSKYENVTWPRLRRRPGARVLETVAYASQFATEYIARR